ncbi:YciI family protein [Gordonia rubripertincta]|uniref:YciI family protein n=1 Tax=Gordonia rubripertincta TaxID=36822 RepID=UPI000B8D2E7D|nr:YciI family protein [Gordonia rubripertincta]ASR03660.1 YciI-like protein [Gordonia rubripertincta]
MPYFAVQYTYRPAKAALRDQYRRLHREWLGEENKAGNVLIAGPYPDGSGALIIISAADLEAAEAFLANDPFQAHQAVDAVRIDEWNQVFGPF